MTELLIKKIKKIHKKLEEETNDNFEIIIKSSKYQNPIVIGTLQQKKIKYIVENMPQFKDLEDTYDSIDEFNNVSYQYCKVHGIKPYINIDILNGNIIYGKEKQVIIGKIRTIT